MIGVGPICLQRCIHGAIVAAIVAATTAATAAERVAPFVCFNAASCRLFTNIMNIYSHEYAWTLICKLAACLYGHYNDRAATTSWDKGDTFAQLSQDFMMSFA